MSQQDLFLKKPGSTSAVRRERQAAQASQKPRTAKKVSAVKEEKASKPQKPAKAKATTSMQSAKKATTQQADTTQPRKAKPALAKAASATPVRSKKPEPATQTAPTLSPQTSNSVHKRASKTLVVDTKTTENTLQNPAPPTKASVDDATGPLPAHATPRPNGMPPYETVAIVLQGGGALGAYQAGVIEGLLNAKIEPDFISGISIGALNTAIIAGNPPEKRIERLRDFWETICQPNNDFGLIPFIEGTLFGINDTTRTALSALQAGSAMLGGQQGFFKPRFPPPSMALPGRPEQASYYDTRELKATLERVCDFDRINSGLQHVSVGAVNVRTGNFVYFDNTEITLLPEHFMASGALPPAFAPVEIDGEYYWDGGLVSNTPLSQILRTRPPRDTLVFQVDLWSARGKVPDNMGEVSDRIKDIQYSSRTRMITEQMRWEQHLRHMVHSLLQQLPEGGDDVNLYRHLAADLGSQKRYNVIHLIYRNQPYESNYKDFQFGPSTMRAHWASGLDDINQTLARQGILDMPQNASGFITHDIHRDATEQARQNADDPIAGAS